MSTIFALSTQGKSSLERSWVTLSHLEPFIQVIVSWPGTYLFLVEDEQEKCQPFGRDAPILREQHGFTRQATPNQSISISIQHSNSMFIWNTCQMHILYCNRDTMISVKSPRNLSFLDMLAVALCVSTSQFLFEIFESLGWPSTGYSLPSLVSFRLPWIFPFSTLSP